MQIASFLRRIILFVARLALPHFSTLSHKRHYFRKTVIKHKMCVMIFSTTFVRNVSHSENKSARHHKSTPVFTKVSAILVRFK